MDVTTKLAILRRRHAEWSEARFGNVGPVGPAKHLAQEALEFAAKPEDIIELADCQMLLWDMQRRAGFTDQQLAVAIGRKMDINEARDWPEPKDGEPRNHIVGGASDAS
jgi:hypothetical protein